jgi:hypothetical protein
MQVALALGVLLLLGGEQYVANLARTGHPLGIEQVPTPNAMNTVAFPAYWQVPRFVWMFLAAPLLTDGQYFVVPWSGETWFWPAYELYFSHYGTHVSVLILALPVAVRWAGRELGRDRAKELLWISAGALALVGFNTLIGLRPHGGFAFIPRFLLFALPLLLVWTWCPFVAYMRRSHPSSWVPLAASMVLPLAYVGVTVTRDGFTPIEYVSRLWSHPEQRREIFHTSWRAATVLDGVAPPAAVVAVDAGYDGWTYPLYGASLTRKVQVIPDLPGPYVPAPDVEWVAVDHAFAIIWGHPQFQSMSLASRYIDQGRVPERDMRVFRSLASRSDFRLVYFLPARFQAVFQRVRRDHQ